MRPTHVHPVGLRPADLARSARRAWSDHFAGAGRHLRVALVATAAMLLSFGSGLLLERAAHLNVDIVFLTVVLSLSLTRTLRGNEVRRRVVSFVVLPLVAVGAGEIGEVMVHHQDLGDLMFVAALSGGIWLRRFGMLAARIGTLVAMPFIALLVTPIPAPPGSGAQWWGAVATLVALGWAWGTEALAVAVGFVRFGEGQQPGHGRTPRPKAGGSAQGPGAQGPGTQASAGQKRRRIPPSSRMALQMALALGGAFALGRWLFPHHWPWMVLTAFIVTSGNRGRGDVVYKALLRFVGAASGTVVAALLAGLFRPHDPAAVAVIFGVLTVATWLRQISYAYWAGCVTAVLSILYGYFGEDSARLLPTRLEEIVLGALLAVAVAWFVTPIRTADVVRGRIAEALAALSEVLAAARRDPGQVAEARAWFGAAVDRLGEVARPVTAHRRVARWAVRHPADALEAVRGCVGPVGVLSALAAEQPEVLTESAAGKVLGRTALSVGEARRSLARRPLPEPTGADGPAGTAGEVRAGSESAEVPRPRRDGGAGAQEAAVEVREAAAMIVEAMAAVRRVYLVDQAPNAAKPPPAPSPAQPATPTPSPAPIPSPTPTATGTAAVIPHSAQDPS